MRVRQPAGRRIVNRFLARMKRNHRDDIEAALAGDAPARVPFTYYDTIMPPDFDFRPLQAKGMAICARRDVYRQHTPNVRRHVVDQGNGVMADVFETPVGVVSARSQRDAYGAASPIDRYIKSPDDYRTVEYIINDMQFEPDYEHFAAERRRLGQGGYVLAQTTYSPLIAIQIVWLGQEQFCYEIADHPDHVRSLYECLARKHEPMYEVVAASPADYVLYGGNIVAAMIDPGRIAQYVLPCWQSFADRLHEQGKKLGVHLDADNGLIMNLVRDSPLDLVEAFTPPPDCPVCVAAARQAWPGKRLWINFPSSVHVQSDDQIRQATRQIVAEAGDRRGFLMGVTEDVPVDQITRSISAILETLDELS